jgi:hypothetical protein
MSIRNQYVSTLNWQSTSPITNFLPNPHTYGSRPSGVLSGTMSGTNTIYTNILDVSRMEFIGMEVTWTGTPTGTYSVLASNSGISFYSLTFSPALGQPAGSAGGYVIDLSGYPFKYLLVEYVNSSGSGVLTTYLQLKD